MKGFSSRKRGVMKLIKEIITTNFKYICEGENKLCEGEGRSNHMFANFRKTPSIIEPKHLLFRRDVRINLRNVGRVPTNMSTKADVIFLSLPNNVLLQQCCLEFTSEPFKNHLGDF